MKETEKLSVLITGGGSGIGAGIAKRFVEKGARVTICGRRKNTLLSLAESLGENCMAKAGDITVENDRKDILEAALSHGGKLDVLVNNAGNIYRGDIDQLQQKPLMDIFNTNVIAGMLLSGRPKMISLRQKAQFYLLEVFTLEERSRQFCLRSYKRRNRSNY